MGKALLRLLLTCTVLMVCASCRSQSKCCDAMPNTESVAKMHGRSGAHQTWGSKSG